MIDASAAPPLQREGSQRVVTRHRGLPGSRAVVGAFLVIVAAVGTFAAWMGATAPPVDTWLTASRPIARGEVIGEEDLTVVLADVAPAQAASILRGAQLDDVVGTIAAVAIGRDAFILGSMVVPPDALDGELFSFSLPADRALGGNVVEGATVDLVATYGGGATAETTYVVRGVRVTRVSSSAGQLGSGSTLVTVLLPDPGTVQRVAHALGNAEVWLVRSGSGTEMPPAYQYERGPGSSR